MHHVKVMYSQKFDKVVDISTRLYSLHISTQQELVLVSLNRNRFRTVKHSQRPNVKTDYDEGRSSYIQQLFLSKTTKLLTSFSEVKINSCHN